MAASNADATGAENTARRQGIVSYHSESRRDTSARRPSRDAGYDATDNYANLNEIAASSPVQNDDGQHLHRVRTLEERRSHHSGETSREARRQSLARTISHSSRRPRNSRRSSQGGTSYDIPDNYVNLDELATPSPVENPNEEPVYLHKSLEEAKKQEQQYERNQIRQRREELAVGQKPKEEKDEEKVVHHVSRFATQLYTISYLILFSFFGTLARLGLQAITFYPGAPVVFSELWANVGGSLVMGFLSEDRMLFKEEWGTPEYDQQLQKAKEQSQDEESGSSTDQAIDLAAAKKAHAATKKTIPLYIGLATGFCGCFTSFSSFIRDAYLAMSNALPTPLNHPADYGVFESSTSTVSRNGGYSFMALLAVIVTTVSLSISALHIGAHLAIFSEPWTPTMPFSFCRKFLDRLAVVLAWGCWLGAIFLAIWPPDRHDNPPEIWRGRAVFALVFAPLGCLGRFYASIYLNSKISSFPLGTFVVNIFGTAIIGMSYDLQHVPLGGAIGCQVLQGIEDGFCGCLTTISTWVSELSSLRRRNAYRYGAASVVIAFCFLVVIMGSLQWTKGFSALQCTH
ncbi:related to chromosome condensation protein (CrcB) [Phialocephala subalpina]|uniref:Related to chromosome condensation protein (CrcB) n=1 Tax=Phialocephala subalpina TaxID=576137 RepID=A0A1L7WX47_9HELO|nr:related to chromosome condensation protein (CrcB) [Phialocephala subalpina]